MRIEEYAVAEITRHQLPSEHLDQRAQGGRCERCRGHLPLVRIQCEQVFAAGEGECAGGGGGRTGERRPGGHLGGFESATSPQGDWDLGGSISGGEWGCRGARSLAGLEAWC